MFEDSETGPHHQRNTRANAFAFLFAAKLQFLLLAHFCYTQVPALPLHRTSIQRMIAKFLDR
jgi:hypothetical protein